jgi:hypothetical protein
MVLPYWSFTVAMKVAVLEPAVPISETDGGAHVADVAVGAACTVKLAVALDELVLASVSSVLSVYEPAVPGAVTPVAAEE